MSIKSVREPNEEEKSSLVPTLVGLGLAFAMGTLAIYFMYFNEEVGRNLYMETNFWAQKSVAEHNYIIQIFETIFKRNYMKSKLEGIGVSALLSLVIDVVLGIPYSLYLKLYFKNQEEGLKR